MWQVLGKQDSFRVFCVLIMVSGVVSYCLAVYQIFLGLQEDKVGTSSGEEADGEDQPMDVLGTKEKEDSTAGVSGQGECSTNNATVWSEMGREREEKILKKCTHRLSKESMELKSIWAQKSLSCPVIVVSDPVEGSTKKRALGKVKAGSCQELWSEQTVETEIPGFVLQKSESNELGEENNGSRKKGKVTYLGYKYNSRHDFPTSGKPKEARRVDASPEEAGSRKWQVSKAAKPPKALPEPSGSTWQLLGNEWVEIKTKKNS